MLWNFVYIVFLCFNYSDNKIKFSFWIYTSIITARQLT